MPGGKMPSKTVMTRSESKKNVFSDTLHWLNALNYCFHPFPRDPEGK